MSEKSEAPQVPDLMVRMALQVQGQRFQQIDPGTVPTGTEGPVEMFDGPNGRKHPMIRDSYVNPRWKTCGSE